jgi:hypothetical protein
MKQYRITSADFVAPGETGDADAVMDAHALQELRKLAGLGSSLLEDYYTAGGHDPAIDTPNDCDQASMSPVGSNISITGMEKRRLEKSNHIQPGSPAWFQLWFSKPFLTGEKPIGDAPAPKIPKEINRHLDNTNSALDRIKDLSSKK